MLTFVITFDNKLNNLVASKLKVAHDVTEDLNNEDTWSAHFRYNDGQVGVTAGVVRDHTVDLLIQVERCAYVSLQTSTVVTTSLQKKLK